MPVGYDPAFGPSARLRISYNQREASQPATFNFFNVGPKWTLNWLSYVTDDPVNAGASVSRFMSGGGAFSYAGYSSATGRFNAQDVRAAIWGDKQSYYEVGRCLFYGIGVRRSRTFAAFWLDRAKDLGVS